MPGQLLELSDEQLVVQCLEHDETAWLSLMNRYLPLLRHVLASYSVPPEDQPDVLQAVWMEAFCGLPDLRNRALFPGWIRKICTRTAGRCKKRLKRNPSNVPIEEVASRVTACPWDNAELAEQFSGAIGLLPQRCKKILRALFYEDTPMPYALLAQRLGVATGSIGFLRGRCLHKLKQILTHAGEAS